MTQLPIQFKKVENSVSIHNICKDIAMAPPPHLLNLNLIRREAVHNFRSSSRNGTAGCKISKIVAAWNNWNYGSLSCA